MLTRSNYLEIKRTLIEELFLEFLEPEREKTIRIALRKIYYYIK